MTRGERADWLLLALITVLTGGAVIGLALARAAHGWTLVLIAAAGTAAACAVGELARRCH